MAVQEGEAAREAVPGEFSLLALDADTRARRGRLATAHGVVETPTFMPVGTYGAVKGMAPWELETLGAEMILGNAYHLAMRPGAEAIEALGGLHEFAGWKRSILTDSGGFQVFSLKGMRRVTDEGVLFQSHIDGSKRFFRPEDVVDVQEKLGVDVAMVLDECAPAGASAEHVEAALRRTTQWAQRSAGARRRSGQLQFGIVQGGLDRGLRERSARALVEISFDGYAVGGLSVGESRSDTLDIGGFTVACLPQEKPRYLMGVGTPAELVRFVAMGFDLFDCVLPTRNARNGMAFTSEGRVVIKNARYRDDREPLDPACACSTCTHFSRAYLRHLFVTGEMLSARLLTNHNLSFYSERMRRLRRAIEDGRFREEAASMGVALEESSFA
ncbi:MAG: tRNA guanosine(34) transglycosylase Tgt [bacterium]